MTSRHTSTHTFENWTMTTRHTGTHSFEKWTMTTQHTSTHSFGKWTMTTQHTSTHTFEKWWTMILRACFFISKAWILSAASKIWKCTNLGIQFVLSLQFGALFIYSTDKHRLNSLSKHFQISYISNIFLVINTNVTLFIIYTLITESNKT